MNTSRWNPLFGVTMTLLLLTMPQAVAQSATTTPGAQGNQSQTWVGTTKLPSSDGNYLDDKLVWDHPIAAKKDPLGPYTYCIPAGTKLVGSSSSLDMVVHGQPGQPVANSSVVGSEEYLRTVLDERSRQALNVPSACPHVQDKDATPLEADSLVFVNAEDLTDADRHEGLLARIVEWIQGL
jgi:hypothetical protein